MLIQRLIKARKQAKLTQDEVAHRLGVVRTLIGKIERKERRLDVIELRDICAAIGIPFITFIQELDRAIEHTSRRPSRKK